MKHEGFGNWDDEYHILKLKEEISIIVSAIVESSFYDGKISRETAKDFYKQMAFMNKNESEIMQKKSDLYYFSGTQSFIGLMEILCMELGSCVEENKNRIVYTYPQVY